MAILTTGANVPQLVQVVTFDPANVPANSVSAQTVTVTGVTQAMQIRCDALSLEAGLFIIGSIPTATNTVTIAFFNPTNADINPASQQFRFLGF